MDILLNSSQEQKLEALIVQQNTARAIASLIIAAAQEKAEELVGLAEKDTRNYIQAVLDANEVLNGNEYKYENGRLINVGGPALSGQAEDVGNGGREDGQPG